MRPDASWLCPATQSRGAASCAPTLSETATAALCSPPSVPRSSRPPSGVRRNAWVTGSPRASVSPVWLAPTMQPVSLMALAQLVRPPSVPRSIMPALAVHRDRGPLPPTTSARLLMPSAMLAAPSVPRSRMPSVAVHTKARGSPAFVSVRPTAAPFSFRSWAMLVAPPRVPRSIIVPGSAMRKACFAGAPAPRLAHPPPPARGRGGGTANPAPRVGGAPGARAGEGVRDRALPLGGAVPQPQRSAPRFSRRAEPDPRPRARVVVVDPRLEYVHRVLLWCLLGHPTCLSFIECKS